MQRTHEKTCQTAANSNNGKSISRILLWNFWRIFCPSAHSCRGTSPPPKSSPCRLVIFQTKEKIFAQAHNFSTLYASPDGSLLCRIPKLFTFCSFVKNLPKLVHIQQVWNYYAEIDKFFFKVVTHMRYWF